MSPLNLSAFANVAQAAQPAEGADAPLLTTRNGVHAVSARRADWAFKSTHRQVIASFLAALKQEYGDGIATMARAMLATIPAGKPLTVHKVSAILSEARAIARTQDEFRTGQNLETGRPIENSLAKAVEGWLTTHPAEPPLSEEEMAALRHRVFAGVVSLPGGCRSARDLFLQVVQGKAPPMREVNQALAAAVDRYPAEKVSARLQQMFSNEAGVHLQEGEAEKFRQGFRALLSARDCRGGTQMPPQGEALEAIFDEAIRQFGMRLVGIDGSDLAPEEKAALRARLFEPGNHGRLMDMARFCDALTDGCHRAANVALTTRLFGAELDEAVHRALAGVDPKQPLEMGQPVRAALERQILETLYKETSYPQTRLAEAEVRQVMAAALAAWATALAEVRKAPESARPALTTYLLTRPEAVDAQYFRFLPRYLEENAEQPLQPLLQASVSAPELATALILLQAKFVGARDFSEALTGAHPELLPPAQAAPAPPVKDAARQATAALYQALDGPAGAALKARLTREAQTPGPDQEGALVRLHLMHDLHRELAERLGLAATVEDADFQRFAAVEKPEQLPLSVRPAGASHYEGDVSLPGRRAEAEIPAALGDAAGYMVRQLQEMLADQLPRHLRRQAGAAELPQFEADMPRMPRLFVGERHLAITPPDPKSARGSVVLQRDTALLAYEDFAHFLTGDDTPFADLTPKQQREVFILAGMFCHQGAEIPLLYAARGVISPLADPRLANGLMIPLSMDEGGKQVSSCLGRTAEGDFVLRYQLRASLHGMERQGIMLPLEATQSFQETSMEVVLQKAELERLAALPWADHLNEPRDWMPPEDWLPRLDLRMDVHMQLQRNEAWRRLTALLGREPSPAVFIALERHFDADPPGRELALPPQCLLAFAEGDPAAMLANAAALDERLATLVRQHACEDAATRADLCQAALALEIARMDTVTLSGLYQELDGFAGSALKAKLALDARENPECASRLATLALLHRALGQRLGIAKETEQAAFAAYPQVEKAADLPIPFRPAGAPRFAGDLDVGTVYVGDAAAAAAAQSREAFADALARAVPFEFLNYGQPGRETTFQKDLMRGLPLCLDGRRLPCNCRGNAAHETKNAYARMARWLDGAAAPSPEEDLTVEFDALPAEKRREVFLVASLANQTVQNPLSVCTPSMLASIFAGDSVRDNGGVSSVPNGHISRLMALSRTGAGDVVLRCGFNEAISVSLPARGKGQHVLLDPQKSERACWTEIVIPGAELQRLARLDWNGIDPRNPPQEYLPRLDVRVLDASLELYPEQP